MKKRSSKKRLEQPISWLPVDSRLFSPLFSFGHVKGAARVFLEIEIVLSVVVVLATLMLAAMSYLQ